MLSWQMTESAWQKTGLAVGLTGSAMGPLGPSPTGEWDGKQE